jgi:L-amino acid N-acyltransferase YncA
MEGFVIRAALPLDVPAITAIYAREVVEASASWELEPPDAAAMLERFQAITDQGYPYFVAEAGSRVIGFAYANAYRPRAGYRYAVEDSVYIAADARGHGVGGALLARLIEACEHGGYRQMVAVIGGADQYGSIRVHAGQGFVEVGRLPALGRKFDRWLDCVLMQRALGQGPATPPG